MPDKARCYREIIQTSKAGIDRYYREFPDRLGDQRSQEALEWSTRGVERILRILDHYSITYIPEAKPDEPADDPTGGEHGSI